MVLNVTVSTQLRMFEWRHRIGERGTGTSCARHPAGRSGKRCQSPFIGHAPRIDKVNAPRTLHVWAFAVRDFSDLD